MTSVVREAGLLRRKKKETERRNRAGLDRTMEAHKHVTIHLRPKLQRHHSPALKRTELPVDQSCVGDSSSKNSHVLKQYAQKEELSHLCIYSLAPSTVRPSAHLSSRNRTSTNEGIRKMLQYISPLSNAHVGVGFPYPFRLDSRHMRSETR